MKLRGQWQAFSGLGLLLLLFFVAGCATTPQRRAQKMPDVIEELSDEDRERVLAGEIAVGDSPEMVYLAWGTPDRKTSIVRDDEEIVSWEYFGYRRDYMNSFHSWHSFDHWYYDRERKHYGLFPYRSIRHPHTATYRVPYLRRRVQFREGAVSTIEQVQH